MFQKETLANVSGRGLERASLKADGSGEWAPQRGRGNAAAQGRSLLF